MIKSHSYLHINSAGLVAWLDLSSENRRLVAKGRDSKHCFLDIFLGVEARFDLVAVLRASVRASVRMYVIRVFTLFARSMHHLTVNSICMCCIDSLNSRAETSSRPRDYPAECSQLAARNNVDGASSRKGARDSDDDSVNLLSPIIGLKANPIKPLDTNLSVD